MIAKDIIYFWKFYCSFNKLPLEWIEFSDKTELCESSRRQWIDSRLICFWFNSRTIRLFTIIFFRFCLMIWFFLGVFIGLNSVYQERFLVCASMKQYDGICWAGRVWIMNSNLAWRRQIQTWKCAELQVFHSVIGMMKQCGWFWGVFCRRLACLFLSSQSVWPI